MDARVLDTELLKDFFLRFKNNGGRRILLTGGEVLLCKNIKEIVNHAVDCGLLVDLFTNGTLVDDDMAKFLSEKINLINISLDGPENHHDSCRGKIGSYQNTVRALRLLKNKNARIALQCMVTASNVNDMDWIYGISEICEPILIKFGHVSNMGRGKFTKDLYLQELNFVKELAQHYLEKYNHFHTRIITNIISKDELKMFYPDFNKMVTPWMFSDGTIRTCYVDDYFTYWELSTLKSYPCTTETQYNRRKLLVKQAYQTAEKKEYFDALQLLSDTAKQIAEKNDVLSIYGQAVRDA